MLFIKVPGIHIEAHCPLVKYSEGTGECIKYRSRVFSQKKSHPTNKSTNQVVKSLGILFLKIE